MQIPQISISIVLDKSGIIPVIRVADTTPGVLQPGISGILVIKQPDGLSFVGNFTNPDIYYISGSLFVAQKELRLANNNNFQKGVYTVTYTARHAGFDDTTITQSFNIDYTRPSGVITPNIDVFTPSLKANDTTNYIVNNFSLQSVTRSWMVTSIPGMTVGGNLTQFDLNIAGQYYDSIYSLELVSVMSYMLTSNTNVSIIDKMEVDATVSTSVPDSLNFLFAAITAYKLGLGFVGSTCKDNYQTKKQNYIYMYTLFLHYIHMGTCGNKSALILWYNEIKAVLNNNIAVSYIQTNAIIPPYNFGAFCGIGSVSLALQITEQPQSTAMQVGQSLMLTVAVSGTPTLQYQWRKNSIPIAGANASSYNINPLQLSDTGSFDVVVTDGIANTITSNPAVITVTTATVNFTAYWGWVPTDPFAALQTADIITYQGNGSFVSGQPIIADYRSAPALQFLVLKVPASEPIKTVWNNTGINNGNIPDDFIYRASFVTAGFRYYVTKQALTLDPTSTTTYS